ncbi:MAG TPA: PilT/PilU family type 4a pilus ATPase [Acidimicrobiales bacterium]|nr:PilT/PilU family type 4a pilus ATPase [Acidimicrobiales bacterium]
MSPVSTSSRLEWSRQLAAVLANSGYIPEATLNALLAEAAEQDVPLATIVIARGAAPAPVVVNALSQLARLPAIDLVAQAPSPDALRIMPPLLAREHQAVAVRVAGRQVVVAFSEPPDQGEIRAMGDLLGYELLPVLGDPTAIDQILNAAEPAPTDVATGTAYPPSGAAAHTPAPSSVVGLPQDESSSELPLHVDDLLRYAVSIGASDLHLTANMPPSVRLHGALRPMEDVEPIDNVTLREMVYGILPQAQRERFEDERELDTSHTIPGVGRFRVNIALQRSTVTVAMRPIPHDIPEFNTLGLPQSVRSFTDLRRGLVLVTGPTGSGKSTSLASMIDIINRSKPLHIVTVEDPIEFLHTHKRSIISQREVGADTVSFSEALRRALRQDPDVILVGEMRDLETISTALTAAETGHLVFATLHTQDAPSTIDRVIDVFPPNQQDQIRIQLGSSLQGVVTQQLIPTADGRGRCVAAEVLICTPAVQNLIRGAKTHQVYSIMQTGGQFGMQTMDQSLALLVKQGKITQGVAIDRCRSEDDFRNHLQGN